MLVAVAGVSAVARVTSSAGGSTFALSFFPSYQWSVTAGIDPRAGNSIVTCAHAGHVSLFTPPASAEIRVGWPSRSAMNAMFAVWQAMSPMAPVPKSQNPRQLKSWYGPRFWAGLALPLYGRCAATPATSPDPLPNAHPTVVHAHERSSDRCAPPASDWSGR